MKIFSTSSSLPRRLSNRPKRSSVRSRTSRTLSLAFPSISALSPRTFQTPTVFLSYLRTHRSSFARGTRGRCNLYTTWRREAFSRVKFARFSSSSSRSYLFYSSASFTTECTTNTTTTNVAAAVLVREALKGFFYARVCDGLCVR